jgi:peptidoglycan/LPS O-acetylase OafA/YrhL
MQSNHRYAVLDALRGICAVLVAVYHISADAWIKAIPFVQNAFLFVDFFFVLSGFVIAANYQEKLRNGFALWRFMFLRFGRLYPLHLFVLLLFLAVAIAKSDGSYPPFGFFVSAAFLHPFSDGKIGNWNVPSWSIAAEMWAYLVFAILCRLNFPRRIFLLAFILLIVTAIPILIWTSDHYIVVLYRPGGLARCLYGFSFGVLTFALWQALTSSRSMVPSSRSIGTVLEVVLSIASLLLVSVAGNGPLSLFCPPLFALTVLVFARQEGLISGALLRPVPAFIGALSYSIYMTHVFIEARVLNLMVWLSHKLPLPIEIGADAERTIISKVPSASDVAVVAMIIVVLALSYLSFRFIEEPFRIWSRSVGRGDAQRAPQVAAV